MALNLLRAIQIKVSKTMKKKILYSSLLWATLFIGCGNNNSHSSDRNTSYKEEKSSVEIKETLPTEKLETKNRDEVVQEKESTFESDNTPSKSDEELQDEEEMSEDENKIEEELINEQEERDMKPENERLDEERIENEEE